MVKPNEDKDIDASATLSCSGLTAYRAVKEANLFWSDSI
jgi:D-arabinose 1-dehydrogenase-like Zn-dependent alcohol dehydrogenase